MTEEFKYAWPNQREAMQQITTALNAKGSKKRQQRVLVMAEPQVGKTGLQILIAVERAKYAISRKRPFMNIFALADSNNALRDQTAENVMKALKHEGLEKYEHSFMVVHRANLSSMALPTNKKLILTVLVDEAHLAAAAGATRDAFQQRVYEFKGERLLVDVGATSFAHMILFEHPDTPYDHAIRLEPGPNYNSIEYMYQQGRLRQVGKLVTKQAHLTPFTKDRIDSLIANGGYTIIRAIGKRHTKLMAAIKHTYPTLNVVEADMFKAPNPGNGHIMIAEIPTYLANKPDKPTLVVVRGALRVGIVLPPEASANIHEMIDTNSIKADTATQSFIGRSCGNGKRKDKYVIYGNLKEIEAVIDCYQGVQDAIPGGLKNRGAHRAGIYELVPPEVVKEANFITTTCSKNNEHDVAYEVAHNINAWQGRYVHLDKPNPKYKESWRALVKKYPDYIGRHVTYNPNGKGYVGATVALNFIDLGYMA